MRLAAFTCLLAAIPLLAQQYTFEVASIKPSNPPPSERNHSSSSPTGNGFRATNVTPYNLLRQALEAQNYQLSGGPGWFRDSRFDIVAKNDVAEDDEIPREDRNRQQARAARRRARILNLLEDRFRLVLREEKKELNAYVLTVEKGGSKMKVATDPKGHTSADSGAVGGFVRGAGISMKDFCDTLASIVERPVLDETGLDGFYDLEIQYALDNSATSAASGSGPSIFTALRESLGLRLTGKKAMVKAWTIVSADKPSEN